MIGPWNLGKSPRGITALRDVGLQEFGTQVCGRKTACGRFGINLAARNPGLNPGQPFSTNGCVTQ